MPLSKYYPLEKLAPIIEQKKKDGYRIALANGGFDLFHIGHVRYLHEAKGLTDLLVVALNSDSSLRQLKGKNRALIDLPGRISLIASLECVDYVTSFDEPRVDRVLLSLTPHIHCKGSDYTPETVPEREIVHMYGGRISIVGGEKIRSTSDIIQTIQRLYS